MKICPNPQCPYRRQHGRPAEYRADIETCAECGAALEVGDGERVPARKAVSWDLIRRALVTVAVLIGLEVLSWITLPGVDREALTDLVSPSASGLGGTFALFNVADITQFSVIALGILPLLSAYSGVELLAVVVPALRPLRTNGPAGRAKLEKAVAIAAALFAAVQGWGITVYLTQLTYDYGYSSDYGGIIDSPGLLFQCVGTATLVAGTMLLWLGARVISAHGIGNGFSVMLASAFLYEIGTFVVEAVTMLRMGLLTPARIVIPILMTGVAAWLTWVWLSTRQHAIDAEEGEVASLPLPSSGMTPIEWAVSALVLPATVSNLLLLDVSLSLTPDQPIYFVAEAGLTLFGCLFFGGIYNQPARIVAAWRTFGIRGDEERARRLMWRGMIGSLIYFGLITGAHAISYRFSMLSAIAASFVVLVAVAVARDVREELAARHEHGALVAVWPIHRVYAVEPAVRMLSDAGVQVLARGRDHRTLLQFFGPYVPVELMVPAADAGRAREILSAAE